jgi:hypothetical protein
MSSKQTAIITGASGGIGAGLVEGFLEEGYNVVATSREAHRDLTTSLPLVWRRLFTPLTYHKGRSDLGPRSHSRAAGLPPLGIRNSEVCLNWRKHATFRSDGRAGLESVIPA